MSYIRSHSNPEALYVFGCGDDVVFMTGSRERLHVPSDIFETLMKRVAKEWQSGNQRSFSYKGFKISEDQKDFKWKIAYKSDRIKVYETTLVYMLTQNYWD